MAAGEREASMTEERVFRVVRERGDKRPVAELVAEQCDDAVPTELDSIIQRIIIDERLNPTVGRA